MATPGRLLDHVTQQTIDLSRVEILVLDEADRMLDMGFIRDIRRVLALLPARRQSLLFSATFSDEIRELAEGLLLDPATVDVAPRNTAAELVDQLVIPWTASASATCSPTWWSRAASRRRWSSRGPSTARTAWPSSWGATASRAAAIHGNKSQGQRIRALEDFKAGRVGILVATDIAARGIDIEALPHVVNYELPMVASDYVHRIGRTGRAGVGGQAVSLVCIDEAELLRDIQRLLRRPLPSELVAGLRARPLGPRGAHPHQVRRPRPSPERHATPPRRRARPRAATLADRTGRPRQSPWASAPPARRSASGMAASMPDPRRTAIARRSLPGRSAPELRRTRRPAAALWAVVPSPFPASGSAAREDPPTTPSQSPERH